MKHYIRFFRSTALLLLLALLLQAPVFAEEETTAADEGAFSGSNIAVGAEKLIGDISAWLVGLSLMIGVAFAIYCLIRRAMADEADGKMWMHRCIVAGLCAVGGALVGGIVSLVASYF